VGEGTVLGPAKVPSGYSLTSHAEYQEGRPSAPVRWIACSGEAAPKRTCVRVKSFGPAFGYLNRSMWALLNNYATAGRTSPPPKESGDRSQSCSSVEDLSRSGSFRKHLYQSMPIKTRCKVTAIHDFIVPMILPQFRGGGPLNRVNAQIHLKRFSGERGLARYSQTVWQSRCGDRDYAPRPSTTPPITSARLAQAAKASKNAARLDHTTVQPGIGSSRKSRSWNRANRSEDILVASRAETATPMVAVFKARGRRIRMALAMTEDDRTEMKHLDTP